MANVPAITTPPYDPKNPALSRWLSDVKTVLENVNSQTSSATITDEQIQALIEQSVQGLKGDPGTPGATGATGAGIPETSVTPVALTGLIAIPSRTFTILTWDSIPTINDAQHTIIYRNGVDDPLTAAAIGTSKTLIYADYTPNDGTYYYWIASQSKGSVATPEGIIGPKNVDSPTISATIDSKITAANASQYLAFDAIGAEFVAAVNLAALSATLGDVTAGTLSNADGTFMVDLINKFIEIAGPAGRTADDYIRIENGEITHNVWTGVTHETGKKLGKIVSGTALNGATVTLPGYWRTQPKIIVTAYDTPIYKAANSGQDQTIQIRAENIGNSGVTTFTEEPRTLTLNGTNINTDIAIEKTSGTNAVWGDSAAYSTETYINGCVAKGTVSNTTVYLMIGLSDNTPKTGGSYININYAIFFSIGTIQIYEDGTYIGSYGTYLSGDELSVTCTNTGDIVYKHNGSTILTRSGVGAGRSFYYDSSFYNLNAKVENIEFNKIVSNVEQQNDVSLINYANTTITNYTVTVTTTANSAEKTAGIAEWIGQAVSEQSYNDGCIAKGTVGVLGKEFVIGLNDSTTSNSNSDINYGLYLKSDNNIAIVENGVDQGNVGTASLSTSLEVKYEDDTVSYLVDSVSVGSSVTTEGRTFYLDTAFYDVGAKITSMVFNEIVRTFTPEDGKWQFDAISRLVLSGNTVPEVINDPIGPQSGDTVTSTVYPTPANTTATTVSVDFSSIRSTAIAGIYNFRTVTWTIYYRAAGSLDIWVPVSAGATAIGQTLNTVNDTQLVTYPSAGSWEFYIEAVCSDAGGTWNAGTGGTQTDTVNLSASNPGAFQDITHTQTDGTYNFEYSEIDLPLYTPPSGWSVDNVDYSATYNYYISAGGSAFATGKMQIHEDYVTNPLSTSYALHWVQYRGSGAVEDGEYLFNNQTPLALNYSSSTYTAKVYMTGIFTTPGDGSFYSTSSARWRSQIQSASAVITISRPTPSSETPSNTLKVNDFSHDLTGASVLQEGILGWQAIL